MASLINPHRTEILLDRGLFIRRTITEQSLGTQDRILASLVESQNTMVTNFMKFGGRPMHLLTNGTKFIVITELDRLPFKTRILPDHNDPLNKCRISFSNIRGSTEFDDPWIVPSIMGKMLFCLYLQKLPGDFTRASACHLLVYKGGTLYSPPYPNVYENSTICMGREWTDAARNQRDEKDLMTMFIEAYNSFHSSQMNGDLTCDYTHQLFQRNHNGWVYPATDNAVLNCLRDRMVSMSYMQGLAL